jgi:uncharacterized protein YjiS (DUF1127 family)
MEPMMYRTCELTKAAEGTGSQAVWRALSYLITRSVRNHVNNWMVRRTIETLQSLDDRTLEDIGLTRGEIEYRVRRGLSRRW